MSGILFYMFDDWARCVSHEKAIKSMKRHNILEIFRCAQNDKTTFCYRRVLQQQVKRSIAVGYAVWVAKSKTSQ